MRKLTYEEKLLVANRLLVFTTEDGLRKMLAHRELFVNRTRVLLADKKLVRLAENISKKQICAVGTILGNLTHGGNFRLYVSAMRVLAESGTPSVWIKDRSEMNICYGKHVLKAHLEKISESVQKNRGVVVRNAKNLLLGFGVFTLDPKTFIKSKPEIVAIVRQGDIGEYLRTMEKS